MTAKKRSYSKQFKIDAVKLVTEQGYKVQKPPVILIFTLMFCGIREISLKPTVTKPFLAKGHMTPEKKELHRLRKENLRLRMEHEIFKKAAVFFAKESM
jgi:transposase